MGSESNGLERGENGRFTVGNRASAGRPNPQFSTKVKDALVAFLELNIDKVQESFDQLKPLEKLQFVANILPYIVPKMSSIQSENNTKLSGGVTLRWINPKSHTDIRPAGNESHDGESLGLRRRLPANSEPGGHKVGEDLHD